jgi:hypothetical protein
MRAADTGADLVVDLALTRSGSARLARLADELAAMAAHAAALPLPEPGLAARRDRLVHSLGHRVITLAVLAEQLRREADVFALAERRAEAGFLGAGRILDAATGRAGPADAVIAPDRACGADAVTGRAGSTDDR